MKDGFKDIIGRQIGAVVVAANKKGEPRNQVFLVFTDGTRFELYGQAFNCCGGADNTDDIDRYVRSGGGQIECVYGDARLVSPQQTKPPATRTGHATRGATPPETVPRLMLRDLLAWKAVKAAIARAKRP